jgi:hypothetical protein
MYRFFSGIFFSLFLFFGTFPLSGESIAPFVLPSARASAMGGNHIAYADDFYAIFTNPAAFVDLKEEFSVAELSLNAYGPVFEILDLTRDVLGSSKAFDLSSIIGPGGFAAGLDIGGPLALGWVGRGLALGFFNRTRFDGSISGTTLRSQISEDIILAGGYSFRILDKQHFRLDAGFLGKGFFRGSLSLDASILDISTIFNKPLDCPFSTYLGLGLDLGIRYSLGENFSAALVCYDVYSPVLVSTYNSFSDFHNKRGASEMAYARVKPRLDAGITYRIHPSFLSRYITRLVISADYRDFTDLFAFFPRNPILNAGIGIEMVLLEVFSIRAGITDALPSVGFGLDLDFMRLDCSIYGKELGFDPGVHSVYAISLGLIFRY